jgi:uncharacterized membrane protein YeaQ/YmgE (transglycosylase-associated protein family)
VLILAIIGMGMALGAFAQWVFGRKGVGKTDWTMAFVAGIGGSFVGGLIASLLAGDGFAIRPSGIIGSFVGALIVTAIWQAVNRHQARAEREQAKASSRHH